MHQNRLLHHLKKLVALYPRSGNQKAVLKALEYCEAVLQSTGGFTNATIWDNSGFYSLMASSRGGKHSSVLLQAHIDVVPATKKPSLKLDKSSRQATGRGVYDMLFAVASYLTFIEQHQAELPSLDLGIMLTGDEELGGFQGVEYLLKQGYGCDVCFLPDAGDGFGDLSISAKGVYNFDLVATGRAHHGSRPWEGDGAANKLVHILHQLLHEFDDSDHDNSTMTVTGLSCGHATNQGPGQATAHLDIRYKDEADFKRIKKLVAKLCRQYGAETQKVLLADNLSIDAADSHIQEFLKLYKKHAAQTISLSKAHGGSDARFFAAQVIPVIMLRPDGAGAHSDQESLSLASLDKFYLLMEEYILEAAKAA